MPDGAVWAVLLSRQVHLTMQFYHDAIGWEFDEYPGPLVPCWFARSRGGELMGIFVDSSGSDFPDASEIWLPHIAVDDVDVRVRAAERLGATILREPFDVPGFGRVAALRQPGGGLVAWRSLPAT